MMRLSLALLLAFMATNSMAAITMQQKTPACPSINGVWEVKRPGQNYSEYYRLTEKGEALLLETHSTKPINFGRKINSTDFKTMIETNKKTLLEEQMDHIDNELCKIIMKDGSVWQQVENITKVHVIYMNHLDVGYNVNHYYPGTKILIPGYILNVLNWYFQVYFPRAARLADELRALRAEETFIYTTHPWLVNLFLDCPTEWELSGVKLQCPSENQLETFRRAVWMGDITWHAGPLNQEAESSNPELFTYSLTLSQKLDDLFNIKRDSRTLSQRDIPGMTRAAIPYILSQNIDAISFGVNGGSAPPDVPSPNVWKFGDHEIITYWHKGGYPHQPGTSPQDPGGLRRRDCQFVDGLDEVLCFIFRSDNLGPPENVQEIRTDFSILRYEFPGAEIRASRFENFTRLLIPLKRSFPVVDAEIGDTWIQGPASDPVKMIMYRTVNRERSQCLKLKQCDPNDKRFDDFSRILIKLPEHTYGLGSCFDNTDWLNTAFQPQQYVRESFRNNTRNYLGHRAFNRLAVDALKDHPLRKRILDEWLELKAYIPRLHGYRKRSLNETIVCKNGIQFRIGSHGGLVQLRDARGIEWASTESPLARILYRTYSAEDYAKQNRQYTYANQGAFWKINYGTAKPESKFWETEVTGVYSANHGDPCEQGVYVRVVHPDMRTWWTYGAPTEYFLHYKSSGSSGGLDIEYQFYNKPATRMVEALFLSFETSEKLQQAQPQQQSQQHQQSQHPQPQQLQQQRPQQLQQHPQPQQQKLEHQPQQGEHRWYLHKLGYWLDPSTVVNNGSQYVHAIDFGVGYLDANHHGLLIESPDVATISVLTDDREADVLPVPLTPMKAKVKGVAFNFYNNVWETNFIFWYPYQPQDKHYKARFRLSFP